MKRPRLREHGRTAQRHDHVQSTAADSQFGWSAAAAIFVLALAVRLIHVWQIRNAPFFSVLMGDSRAYDEWAQQIALGDWLGHDVFYQAPLYPYFLGTLYAIAGHDLLLVRLAQVIIGSLSCVLLGLAGAPVFSPRTGLIAGLGLALYAPAIFFDALLQKSVLDVFFVCLTLWVLSGLTSEPQKRLSWLWLGMAMGGLSLTRENALVLIGVILVWVLIFGIRDPGSGIRKTQATRIPDPRSPIPDVKPGRAAAAGIFLLGLTIVLLPIAVRNSVLGDGLYLTTSQFGPNFYIGNNARADGTYMSLRFGRGSPEYERQDATELAEAAMGRHLTPADVSAYWTRQALAFIRAEPLAWAKLLGRKFALLWNRSEMLDTESLQSHAEWSMAVRLGSYVGHFGVLVPLAFLGVVLTWPLRGRLWVIYGLLTVYAASVVMFYAFARYRYPLVPILMLFAGAGLVALPRQLRTDVRATRWVALGAALLTVAAFVNRPMLSADLMRAITEHNLGAALQEEGRFDEAIEHYRRALVFKADYAPSYSNMGTALRAKGQLPEAIATYQQALALRPDYSEAHYNLANALLDEGKLDDAIDQFRGAMRSTPGSVDVHNNLGIALASKGRADEAITEFLAALRLDPDSSKAHRNLGDALASRGRQAEAIEHLRRAVQLDPADGSARYDLGSVLLEAGMFKEATDQFAVALQLMPDSAEAYNNLGIALASQGQLEKATDQFQQALRLQPGFVDAQQNLAKLRGAARRAVP